MKDLYGQRHITYFDPSCKFENVESIEQFENEDSNLRMTLNNNYQIKHVSYLFKREIEYF